MLDDNLAGAPAGSALHDSLIAEEAFRRAFNLLKRSSPERAPKGTPVSQNNIAKEAGCDPSALRKERYPRLISEIQGWVRDHPAKAPLSQRQETLAKRQQNSEHKARIEEIKIQRDRAGSLLAEADTKIVELTMEVADLKAKIERLQGRSLQSNVTPFRHRSAPKR
jgi:hypothetical protein